MREGYGSGPSAGDAVLKADLNNVEDMNASLRTFFVCIFVFFEKRVLALILY